MAIDLATLRIFNKADVLKFLRKHKLPLDRIAVADSLSHYLYMAEGNELSLVLDPYTGDPVQVESDIQTFITDHERSSDFPLHTVFLDESGSVCTDTGMACVTQPVSPSSWTSAMLELTFGSNAPT